VLAHRCGNTGHFGQEGNWLGAIRGGSDRHRNAVVMDDEPAKLAAWPLESYINGVHTFAQPQPWLFPIFPWVAFAFVGSAVGFLLLSDFGRKREVAVIAALGVAGIAASLLSMVFDAAPVHLYSPAIYDYWHTSPNFFLVRIGILLALILVVYAWCAGDGSARFSPIIQLGNTSLLVYWIHIEFVYGRFSILPKGRCSIGKRPPAW